MVKRPDQTADLGLVDAFTSGTRPGDRDDLLERRWPGLFLLITHQGLLESLVALTSRTTRPGDQDDLLDETRPVWWARLGDRAGPVY